MYLDIPTRPDGERPPRALVKAPILEIQFRAEVSLPIEAIAGPLLPVRPTHSEYTAAHTALERPELFQSRHRLSPAISRAIRHGYEYRRCRTGRPPSRRQRFST